MMRIILIGMKGCGKTTIGTLLAAKLQVPFIDSDTEIERTHQRERGEALSFRQIFKEYGEVYFNSLDMRVLKHIAEEFSKTDVVFACAGRTPLQEENQEILRGLGKIVFLNLEKSVLLKRILTQGIPAFFPYPDDPERSFNELVAERFSAYTRLADITLDISEEEPEIVVRTILEEVRDYGKN
jgi:shikimate kinase